MSSAVKIGSALIVDDEENVREMVSACMKELGLDVAVAASGARGLDLLETEEFAVMFVDLRIPEPNGMELLRWAAENRPLMPVFVLTAYATAFEAVEAVELGAVDFLSKPSSLEEIRRHTLRVLSAGRGEQEENIRPNGHSESFRINDRQFDTAAVHVYDAIRRNPSSAEAYSLLGVLYRLRGFYREARRCFERALSLDFACADALRNLRELPGGQTEYNATGSQEVD